MKAAATMVGRIRSALTHIELSRASLSSAKQNLMDAEILARQPWSAADPYQVVREANQRTLAKAASGSLSGAYTSIMDAGRSASNHGVARSKGGTALIAELGSIAGGARTFSDMLLHPKSLGNLDAIRMIDRSFNRLDDVIAGFQQLQLPRRAAG